MLVCVARWQVDNVPATGSCGHRRPGPTYVVRKVDHWAVVSPQREKAAVSDRKGCEGRPVEQGESLARLLTRSLHAKLMAVQRMAAPLNSTLSLGNFPSESMPCDCGAANSIARRPT